MKKLVIAGLLAGLLVAIAMGPRAEIEKLPDALPLSGDLDAYLAAAEARFPDITPGTEKTIVWANPDEREPTEVSIVYLHGFSATRQETTPLTDRVAGILGANVYYARLAGHGRGSQPLGEATAEDWLADTREAFDIGRQIGKRVVIVGVSTGATLGAWLASTNDVEELAALVFISPNFGLADKSADILNWPWGLTLAVALTGETRSFSTQNEAHAKYWTSSYRLDAAAQMMALVKFVNDMPLANIHQPYLYIRSDRDRVIDMAAADAVFDSLKQTKQKYVLKHTDDSYGHVIAGDILSPASTDELVQIITDFIRKLP